MATDIIDLPGLNFNKPEYSNIPPAASCMCCRKVPLDNSYRNTLTFTNEAEQLAYFESKAARKYESISPIALGKPIRMNIAADGLFDCNYAIIKNSNITSKNMFVFITKIEYVNMNCCDLYFEIDFMQTYYFNMNIRPCFVEREHVNDDTIGKHIINEGLAYSDYKEEIAGNPPNLGNKVIIMQKSDADKPGDVYGGIYHGVSFTIFTITKRNELRQVLQKADKDGNADSIISLSMGYSKMIPSKGTTSPAKITHSIPKHYTTLDGYKPKNNKLYAFPYNFLYCDNGMGQSGAYKFEYFSGNTCNFELWGTYGGGLEITLIPISYNGVGYNFDERMEISGFPMCSWVSDTYKAWFAQNKYGMAIDGVSAALGLFKGGMSTIQNVAMGAVTQNYAQLGSGVVNAFTSVADTGLDVARIANQFYQASIAPDKVHGNTSNASIFASNQMNFHFKYKTLRAEDARSIDNYLTVFGYRVNRVKSPNITGRKSWNYVKTIGSAVTGDIPFNFLNSINQIFDRGIFFWHGDFVGDFGRDNAII